MKVTTVTGSPVCRALRVWAVPSTLALAIAGGNIVHGQEAWQGSWPAFVSALAKVQEGCTVPTYRELSNPLVADVIFINGTATWLLDRGNPRVGSCQAVENDTFGGREVTWEAVVASVNRPSTGPGNVSLKLTPPAISDASQPVAKLAGEIIYLGAVLSPDQASQVVSAGQRVVVRGVLPKTKADSMSGVLHSYDAGDRGRRGFVVELISASFTIAK